MNTAAASLSFDGVICPHCSYDVRGLPRAVCPECGQAFDPTAVKRVRPVRQVIGYCAALITMASAYYVVQQSHEWLWMYIENIGSWCGTPRMSASAALGMTVPIKISLPAATVGITFWAKCGSLLAVTATFAAVAGWGACYVLLRML